MFRKIKFFSFILCFRTLSLSLISLLIFFSHAWGRGLPPPLPDDPVKIDRNERPLLESHNACKTTEYKGKVTFNSFEPTGKTPFCKFNIKTYWGDYSGNFVTSKDNPAFILNACRAAEKASMEKQEVWLEGNAHTCQHTWGTNKYFEGNFILLESEALPPSNKMKDAFAGEKLNGAIPMGIILTAPGQVLLYKTYSEEEPYCQAILRVPPSTFSPKESDYTYFEVSVTPEVSDKKDSISAVFNSQAFKDCTALKNAFFSEALVEIKGEYMGWSFKPILKLISLEL